MQRGHASPEPGTFPSLKPTCSSGSQSLKSATGRVSLSARPLSSSRPAVCAMTRPPHPAPSAAVVGAMRSPDPSPIAVESSSLSVSPEIRSARRKCEENSEK